MTLTILTAMAEGPNLALLGSAGGLTCTSLNVLVAIL